MSYLYNICLLFVDKVIIRLFYIIVINVHIICRLVREIPWNTPGGHNMNLQALWEAVDTYLMALFEDCSLCAINMMQVMIMSLDIQMARKTHVEGSY